MNLKMLFQMQAELDEKIRRHHLISDHIELFHYKILAFRSEVCKVMNEIPDSYQYWIKEKKEWPRSVVLEAYLSAMQFLLSLGVESKQTGISVLRESSNTITAQFIVLFQALDDFSRSRKKVDYMQTVDLFFGLGEMLGFTSSQIEKAYIDFNYEQQKELPVMTAI